MIAKWLLSLASLPYGVVVRARNALFDCGVLRTYRSRLKVISVGNVTVGGTAKTPLCIYLARELSSLGRRPVILSRGYGGSTVGPHLVTEQDSADRVGDEPLLMQRLAKVPVLVARRRVAGAKFIEAHNLGDVIILDDGLQHRWLGRDLEIVCVNTATPEAVESFVAGALLPCGTLREPRARALARADVVVLSERRAMTGALGAWPAPNPRLLECLPKHVAIFRSALKVGAARRLSDGQELAPSSSGPVVAFCGIANPEGFFETVRSAGFNVVAERAFPDHHPFAAQELESLIGQYPGAILLCTAKDAVRIPSQFKAKIYGLDVDLLITQADAFRLAVREALGQGA